MSHAIETHQLTKIYDKPQGWRRIARLPAVTAVSDINLTVPEGSLFGLLGPNGAGKTTLVKMLCTLILPTSGTAVVAGHELRRMGAIRGTVGLVVSDERSFYWRLSARRNLRFFAAMYGLTGRAAEERVVEVLTAVDLLDVADRRFSDFSSGMKQRLAIARSLLHRPRILFLDEPTRSLDPTATQRLHDLVLSLMAGQGMTVFLITHDLAEAEKLCPQVALMHKGRIQAVGDPASLKQQLSPMRRYTITLDAPVDPAILPSLTNNQQSTINNQQLTNQQINQPTNQLTFAAAEHDGLLTAVLDALHQHHHTILTIDSQPPTLEEVFAHFTKDEG